MDQEKPEISIRTCANCRRFEALGEGCEIGRIEDTRFLTSTCNKLGWKVKEHYLFPAPEAPELRASRRRPFWEAPAQGGAP